MAGGVEIFFIDHLVQQVDSIVDPEIAPFFFNFLRHGVLYPHKIIWND